MTTMIVATTTATGNVHPLDELRTTMAWRSSATWRVTSEPTLRVVEPPPRIPDPTEPVPVPQPAPVPDPFPPEPTEPAPRPMPLPRPF